MEARVSQSRAEEWGGGAGGGVGLGGGVGGWGGGGRRGRGRGGATMVSSVIGLEHHEGCSNLTRVVKLGAVTNLVTIYSDANGIDAEGSVIKRGFAYVTRVAYCKRICQEGSNVR
jgi:hypothetical protein